MAIPESGEGKVRGWQKEPLSIMWCLNSFVAESSSQSRLIYATAVWVIGIVKFSRGRTKFALKMNKLKGNSWILRIGVITSCQKLGIILVIM